MDEHELKSAVHDAYSEAARNPAGEHPFPVGRSFAEGVGYPRELLGEIPSMAVQAFTGVSNVSVFAGLSTGQTVLDLGCGAGLDSLVAARRVGPLGGVIGVDFSEEMLQRARVSAQEARLSNVSFQKADAGALPLETGSVDVALVNGLFNLNPQREAIFAELARVLHTGGYVFAAELVLLDVLPPKTQATVSDWFA